ncbi:MAG TPA: alpha/beta fold hydrolase [Burkholderiales bacterium]|nr:alpha/beta fold hydrolase [Burkholderiales bacterium]
MKVLLKPLSIDVDGQAIAGSLLLHTPAVPGVLFVHGWGGSQEQDLERAREAAALGCVCLTFDLRGHNLTRGQRDKVSRADNLRDLIAAYDLFAAQPSVEESAIAVVGSSYGAYLAALLSTYRPVRWLGLRAPALYKDDNWEVPKRQLNLDPDLAAYRRKTIAWQDNLALRACAQFRGDVLMVESEHDELIPHAVVANHLAAFSHARSVTYRTLAGADHALSHQADQRGYTTLLMNWLTEMVLGARAEAVPPEVPAQDKKPEPSDAADSLMHPA